MDDTKKETNLFETVPFNERKASLREAIEIAATELYKILDSQPKSREMSLSITYLENSVMWAIKGVSRQP